MLLAFHIMSPTELLIFMGICGYVIVHCGGRAAVRHPDATVSAFKIVKGLLNK